MSDAAAVGHEKTVRWASPAYQQGFTMVPNVVLLDPSLSVYAHRVYGLLLYYARQDESCWPGQEGLAERAVCSERAVRTAIRDLEKGNLLNTKRRGQGRTNMYLLLDPPVRAAPGAGLDLREAPSAALEGHTEPLLRDKDAEEEDAVLSTLIGRVESSWLDLAPPLIAHPAGYFKKPQWKSAVESALRTYSIEAIERAIGNYAAVLSSPDHYWTHRYKAIEFLYRPRATPGIDHFADEADPLGNYRTRKPTGDFSDIAEL